MGHDADVGVEAGIGAQRQQVTTLLGVDEQHLLPGAQQALVVGSRSPLGVHGAQEFVLDDEPDGLELITRRSPGFSLVR